MIPSRSWFRTVLAERVAWVINFATQFANYAVTLGFTPDDVISVENDSTVFQSVAATRLAAKNFERAVADYLRRLTESDDPSEPLVFPSEDFDGPPLEVPAGMFKRIEDWRTRILASPGYTETIGLAMGILPSGDGGDIAEADVKPETDVSAAVHGYLLSIVVSGRHRAESWQVWVRQSGTSEWHLLDTATGRSADFTYSPVDASGPVQLEVYVQLRRNNQNYGQPSDIGLVTVNP